MLIQRHGAQPPTFDAKLEANLEKDDGYFDSYVVRGRVRRDLKLICVVRNTLPTVATPNSGNTQHSSPNIQHPKVATTRSSTSTRVGSKLTPANNEIIRPNKSIRACRARLYKTPPTQLYGLT